MTAPATASARLRTWQGVGTGLVAGLAAGLLGIGGGLVMVPLMALAGVPLKRAVGTSLLGVLAIASTAVATELLVAPHNVRWAVAVALAVGAVVGSWAGTRVVAATPPPVLARLLAALLVVAAARMSGVFELLSDAPGGPVLPGGALAVTAHVAVGLAAGVISALFGVGGGILAVPVLGALHADWTFQACRATSLAMIVPTALAGAVLHGRLEHVDRALARSMVPGSLLGVVAGVVVANRATERPLELLFAALLVVAAVRLVRRVTRSRA